METPRSRRFIFQNTEKVIQTALLHFDKAVEMWDYLYQTFAVILLAGIKESNALLSSDKKSQASRQTLKVSW